MFQLMKEWLQEEDTRWGFLRDNQLLFYADEKYSSVYETFAKLKQEKKFETKHLFIYFSSINWIQKCFKE